MSRFTVQRYCAKNDANGNPRRVYVIRDESGEIVRTVDEGYAGRSVVYVELRELIGPQPNEVLWSEQGNLGFLIRRGIVADLGDVDVSPGVYRRMKNYRPDVDHYTSTSAQILRKGVKGQSVVWSPEKGWE